MNKIIEAIKTMIANPGKITNVMKARGEGHPEFFFLYDNKYKWSIMSAPEDYNLYYYAVSESIKELANLELDDWMNVDFITYKSKDFNSNEITSIFKDFYSLVKEKYYKIDEAIDAIIKGT